MEIRHLETQPDSNPSTPDRGTTGSCAFDADLCGLEKELTTLDQRALVFRVDHDQAVATSIGCAR